MVVGFELEVLALQGEVCRVVRVVRGGRNVFRGRIMEGGEELVGEVLDAGDVVVCGESKKRE